MLEIKTAEPVADRQVIQQLFKEYADGLQEDLCFQGFTDELNEPFKKYSPPLGCIFIAYYEGLPAGCIALQPLTAAGVCEMKRLYVRHEYRSNGIGDKLVARLLIAAAAMRYHTMVLDTLDRLQPAIRLYERHGFVITEPYYANPLPGVVYMQRGISASAVTDLV
ncbi:N-acetyltransferase [Segetibacter sp. 3557_3]|uniref:GNAT family N-acetyltransferase n=1 Tax=Segetibacter sp. 3557_3 TaxID=2547429 RepID=UPI001058529A|nr:GNAT family N-acetyltransferase [Segetibacter sp. 3557_3]TDH24022.1 N-acetyltransferase [Segetibacter sp. 3557_3]